MESSVEFFMLEVFIRDFDGVFFFFKTKTAYEV